MVSQEAKIFWQANSSECLYILYVIDAIVGVYSYIVHAWLDSEMQLALRYRNGWIFPIAIALVGPLIPIPGGCAETTICIGRNFKPICCSNSTAEPVLSTEELHEQQGQWKTDALNVTYLSFCWPVKSRLLWCFFFFLGHTNIIPSASSQIMTFASVRAKTCVWLTALAAQHGI